MHRSGAFTVHRPNHWIFEGPGLKRGVEFGGADTIVAYECEGCQIEWREGAPYATRKNGAPANLRFSSPLAQNWEMTDSDGYDCWRKAACAAVVGTCSNGGTVVTVGTADWSHGLKGNDPAVTRITRNILNRLG